MAKKINDDQPNRTNPEESLLKRLQDPDQFSTAIIGKEGENADESEEVTEAGSATSSKLMALVVDLLTNPLNKLLRERVWEILKEDNGFEVLQACIDNPKFSEHRALLIATFWEAGIECSHQLPYFSRLAMDDDYSTSMEAITVIEEMRGPFIKMQLEQTVDKFKNHLKGPGHSNYMLEDLLKRLETELSLMP